MDEHGGKFLVTEGGQGRLYIYWDSYNGKDFLHIRYWYLDKSDSIFKPGRKGIAIEASSLPTALKGFRLKLGEYVAKEQQVKQALEQAAE